MFREPNYAEDITQTGDSSMKGQPLSPLLSLLKELKHHHRLVWRGFLGVLIASFSVLALGQGVRVLVDQGFSGQETTALSSILFFMLAVIGLLAFSSFNRVYYLSWLGEKIVADLRTRVFDHLITREMFFFESRSSGFLISSLLSDTTLIQVIITTSFPIAIRNILLFFGGITFLFLSSFHLTVWLLVTLPIVLIPLMLYGKRVKKLSKVSQERLGDLSALSAETFDAIQTIQAFQQENTVRNKFSSCIQKTLNATLVQIKARAQLSMLVMILVFGSICLVLWVGGQRVQAGHITSGDLSAFLFYAALVGGSAGAISEIMGDLQRAAGAMERILELLNTPCTIENPSKPFPIPLSASYEPTTGEIYPHLQFENVSFSYPGRLESFVLSHFTLKIQEGEHVAIVGPSGVGKSTLFKLALRFYDPQEGSVYYRGKDIRLVSIQDLRRKISWVSQQTVLFDATLEENILYGNPEASKEDVINVLKATEAWDFSMRLPNEIKTPLGIKGDMLSGGEKQRLVLARALLKNAPLLLLDEATSALDAQNERLIQRGMQCVMKGRTAIVIAHRLATVQHADRIIVLDHDGKIAGIGTHPMLIETVPLYRDLVNLEFIPSAEKEI